MREEAPINFIDWFKNQLKTRNLGIRAAARFIGVSHPTISDIITYHKKPSCETCLAIADAFRVSRESVLRLAGWLEPIPEKDDLIEQALIDLGAIPIEAKRTVVRVIHTIREEAEEYRT